MKKEPSVQLDLYESERRKQEGIDKAATGADANDPGWQDKAYAFLVTWLFQRERKFKFLLEEARADAAKAGIPEPPDNRAWGWIALKAKKDKLIKGAGYGQCADVKGHRHPVTIWQKI